MALILFSFVRNKKATPLGVAHPRKAKAKKQRICAVLFQLLPIYAGLLSNQPLQSWTGNAPVKPYRSRARQAFI
jgi:hypothetical protein